MGNVHKTYYFWRVRVTIVAMQNTPIRRACILSYLHNCQQYKNNE